MNLQINRLKRDRDFIKELGDLFIKYNVERIEITTEDCGYYSRSLGIDIIFKDSWIEINSTDIDIRDINKVREELDKKIEEIKP